MGSLYSVIYVQTNAAAQDRLAIGMLLTDPSSKRVLYDYSLRKLHLISELVNPGMRTGLKWSLDNLRKLTEVNNADEAGLFRGEPIPDQDFKFTDRYLKYLATYHQNLLHFSQPVRIDLPTTTDTFSFLYEEQIDDVPTDESVHEQRRDLLTIKDRPIIRQHFSQEVRIDQELVNSVRIPVKVSLYGRNGVDYFAKIIDPYRSVNWLNRDAASFLSLALQTPGDVHYLISQEPDARTFPQQHASWRQFREVSDFRYVDASEIGVIEREAEARGVRPVVGEEEE